MHEILTFYQFEATKIIIWLKLVLIIVSTHCNFLVNEKIILAEYELSYWKV